jgi:hypothetical protein
VGLTQNKLIKLGVDFEFQPLAMRPEWRKHFEIRRTVERFLRILAVLKRFLERRAPEGRIAGRPFLCFFLFDAKRKKASWGVATPGHFRPGYGARRRKSQTFFIDGSI